MKRKMRSYSRLALSILAVLGLCLISLNVDGAYLNTGEAANVQKVIGLTQDNPGIRTAIEVQGRHSERLMGIPGVVGHGVGISSDGKPVITIFVMRAGIPEIPAALEGVPTEVEVTGVVVAYADPTARFDRPVPIGVSTGHPDITAGTIGCRVTDGTNVYALSNNHVYANSNEAFIGDNALQPGPDDGGQDHPADAIGTLYAYETIWFDGSKNYIDAAIASTTTSLVDCVTPADGYGAPSSTTVAAFVGQAVQKYGRTTGLTHGQVAEINVTVDVCYECAGPWCFGCKKLARFVDQIAITPGAFSAGGDSGSLIVTDDDNNNPVGLLFAGSSERTIANPIDPVLERFNVSVSVDDSSTSPPVNSPPTAGFSYTTSELTVTFTDQSSDSDGSVVAWDWDFGDDNTSTEQNPTYTYMASGSYTVTLTVTDDDSATDSVSKDVTVSKSGDGITLTATGYKVRGRQKADLQWSGAGSTDVDIYRDGAVIATTANDGFYTDNIDRRGPGSYVYKVCEEGFSTCSNEATVTF